MAGGRAGGAKTGRQSAPSPLQRPPRLSPLTPPGKPGQFNLISNSTMNEQWLILLKPKVQRGRLNSVAGVIYFFQTGKMSTTITRIIKDVLIWNICQVKQRKKAWLALVNTITQKTALHTLACRTNRRPSINKHDKDVQKLFNRLPLCSPAGFHLDSR